MLVAMPFVAACDSMLDMAGLERSSANQTETSAPQTPTPPARARARQRQTASIAEVQELLNELGYDAGPVDGIAGPRTNSAIQKYKADRNLPVDDHVTPLLTATLRNEANSTPASPNDGTAGLPSNPIAIDETDTAAGTVVSSTTLPRPRWRNIYDVSDQPYYEVGDNYIYSTGRIETAVQVTPQSVNWVVNDGSRYSAEPNFLLPPQVWKDRQGEVTLTFESNSANNWPPANTSQVIFTARQIQTEGAPGLDKSWLGQWLCESEAYGKLAVPAGQFSVVKISCEKTDQEDAQSLRRVWYYAPDIRHYVRYEESSTVSAESKISELIAIRPGRNNWTRSARSGFKWAIQKLLDGGRIGDSIEWNVAESSIEFDISVTGEFQAADNIDCRRYLVVRKKPGNPRIFPALACRDNISGRWKIPGLEKGSVLPEDVLALR